MSLEDIKEIRMYQPITLNDVFSLFDGYTPESIAATYKGWVHEFYHRVGVFTNVRRLNYERALWNEFCEKHNYDSNNYLTETTAAHNEWKTFYDYKGMGNHLKKIREFQQSIAAMEQGINTIIDEALGDKLYGSDLAFEWESTTLLKKLSDPRKSIDAIWFNEYINNSDREVKDLRSMPYNEYLRSSHWRNVRDAIMMLYGCHCQGNQCNWMGDSGYGGAESLMHIHHKTYENRGNERYEDLVMLCDKCHAYEHGIVQ